MSTPMKPLPSRTQTIPSSRFWFNRQVQKSIGLYKIVASTTPKDYKSTKGNLKIYVQFSMEPGSQCWTRRSRSQGPLSGIFRKPQDQLLYLQLEQRSLSSVQKSTVSHFFWINSKRNMPNLQKTATKILYITWKNKKNGILLPAYECIGC